MSLPPYPVTYDIGLLSLWQPWASAIALGKKRNETRSWKTNRFQWVAIHSTLRPARVAEINSIQAHLKALNGSIQPLEIDGSLKWMKDNPKGCIVALAHLKTYELINTRYTTQLTPLERCLGNYNPDGSRYSWEFDQVIPLDDLIQIKGGQGITPISDPYIKQTLSDKISQHLITQFEQKLS